MEIIFDVENDTLICEFFGEIDHNVSECARKKIDTALDNYKIVNLVFDFSKVTFMDSSGIGMVLGRYRKLGECSDKLAITGCSKSIRNILNMAGIFSIIDYYDTRKEAVAKFERKGEYR